MTWEREPGGTLTDAEVVDEVRSTLDSLPDRLAERLRDVAVIVEDTHPEDLMGIYDPEGGVERIVIFREANPSREEVRRTVLHEIGHAFGMSEEEIRELGYG